MSEQPPAKSPEAAYSRLTNAADKVFTACEDMSEFGGIAAVADGWTVPKLRKTADALRGVRKALDDVLGDLDALAKARRHQPRCEPRPDAVSPGPNSGQASPEPLAARAPAPGAPESLDPADAKPLRLRVRRGNAATA